jgi:hypothetical protein
MPGGKHGARGGWKACDLINGGTPIQLPCNDPLLHGRASEGTEGTSGQGCGDGVNGTTLAVLGCRVPR